MSGVESKGPTMSREILRQRQVAAANWLNYHHLYYFWTIANEGSIARAAEKLNVGQPTLSTQLKQLEDSLGRPLFERKNRRLTLTDAGKTAFQYAHEIFRLGSEMIEAVHDLSPLPDRAQIHLQIGALDSVPKSFVMELVESALATGNCQISILEGKADELLRELAAHRIDLMLSNSPPALDETGALRVRSVGKVPISFFTAPDSRPVGKTFPDNLQGQNLVLPTYHSKLRHDVEHWLRLHKINAVRRAETEDTSLLRLLGVRGLGMVPLAEAGAEDLVRQKSLVRVGRVDGVYEEIWLISTQRKVENPVAAKLQQQFRLTNV
ncbi:MAG TPA: LysR family transcriptional regulator [Pseudobdellovibrionaceae bacterium]|nr:LysR family transcriptional regulator [Pseudobdellovibrionaceae bacterium]